MNTPKSFVSKFFNHEQVSVKVTHNPNAIRKRFASSFFEPATKPEQVYGWAIPRSPNSSNWRKSLIFINKNLPKFIVSSKRQRRGFEVEYTTAHELAHVYAKTRKETTWGVRRNVR